ncbi:MAG: MotA/TolQ/ExbB proton channel family protein [Bacteroidaceae bacterium]|nr:MotA/TolQ/ExbB proton channel family protein [Candidatus Colenecus caballi]MCQ2071914.1 MotA/TolQ/ExbB proton channel family protein [Bacteroidaceae bacterium]
MNNMFLQATLAQALGDTVAQSQVAVQLAEDTADKMNLLEMAMKGGWIMVVLLLLSLVCFYIFFNRIAAYRKAAIKDPNFMARITDYMKSGENKSAIIFCQATNSPLSRIVEKGIGLADHDSKDIQMGMENAANIEIAKLEKGLSGMSTIASAAPMIGFLGTVTGMVRAFWEMANAGNNIDVSLLSGGIYEAMITTVGGLIVGIIALFAYNYLVSRVDDLTNQMESFIQDFTVNVGK